MKLSEIHVKIAPAFSSYISHFCLVTLDRLEDGIGGYRLFPNPNENLHTQI